MADDVGYWSWRDALLKHPDGRAKGGEPCVRCGGPVPPNAHWKHRDRHVCSARCNTNLARQFNRKIRDRGIDTDFFGRDVAPIKRVDDPRTSGPRTFRTVSERQPPYEFEGFRPRPGDVVERHGILTTYEVWHREPDEEWHPDFGDVLAVVTAHSQDGAPVWWRLDNWGSGPVGQPITLGNLENFYIGGIECRWGSEFISDVTDGGHEYRWEATIALPVDSPHQVTYWTAARTTLSERRKRATSNEARHRRRVRIDEATVERFDPLGIYERDGWVCQLCGDLVDRDVKYPDPMCASLDHVIPLAAGGEHSRSNSQLAHWICNVRKGSLVRG